MSTKRRRRSPEAIKRHREKWIRRKIFGHVFSCFCEGRNMSADLLKDMARYRVIDDWPKMKEESAVSIITAAANQSRAEHRKNTALFQAWLVVGNPRFWQIIDQNKIRPLPQATTVVLSNQWVMDVPSSAFHHTARRFGEGRMVRHPSYAFV